MRDIKSKDPVVISKIISTGIKNNIETPMNQIINMINTKYPNANLDIVNLDGVSTVLKNGINTIIDELNDINKKLDECILYINRHEDRTTR
jgi:hypothetical protein